VALFLPQAVSVSRFVGGYKAVSDYTDLSDTETSDSKNTIYGPNADIEKRLGSIKLLNSSVGNSGVIVGHYYFDKLGGSGAFHIVAAGDSLYNYTSSTASAIRTGLSGNNSTTFWNFVQIQDPRSAADDIAIGTNGADPIHVWTGSGTAVLLSSFTSATQVPIAKFILSHKERIYAANITDAADADSPVKVARSGFGSDGAADPHRFRESFYAGGSSRNGEIQGLKVLNDQIMIYTRRSVWRYSPGTGDLGDLQELQGSLGVLAPGSLVDAGNYHIFLSERGVHVFDGVNFVHISEKVDEDILGNSNFSRIQNAKAVFNARNNQYILYYADGGYDRNNRALVYDLRIKAWQPPVTGRQVSCLSHFFDSTGAEREIYGDYKGFLYQDGGGTNDGLLTGYNGSPTSQTFNTMTDSAGEFPTAGDGLRGIMVRIISGRGEGQERIIQSNDSNVITLESDWTNPPDSSSVYTIGGIDAHWRSKDYDFGGHDLIKLFSALYLRCREDGNYNLTLHYIVDFKELAQAASRLVSLLENGFAWGVGVWGTAIWGARSTIRRKINFSNISTQITNGTHLAVRFYNGRANETFRISGFDLETKPIGKI